jgi:sporulation protein YlmC with PRC-barrel domain
MLTRLSTAAIATALASSLALPAAAQTAPPGTFLTQMPEGAVRTSQIIGADVIGSDIAKLGEIEDVVIDREGKVGAVVIGVGGVLGMGGKNVAVPYASLLWNFKAGPNEGPRSSNTGGTPTQGGTQTQGAAATAPGPANPTATGTVGDPARPGDGLNVGKVATPLTGGELERAVLTMTKDELAAAPEFKSER